MKKMMIALAAVVATLPLAACVSDGYYAGPVGPDPIAYDGFYDDYYGPVYDGYWGDGGVFYYRNGPRGHWRPDRAGHFRHDMGEPIGGGHAFHPMHGSFTPPAGHGGRHH